MLLDGLNKGKAKVEVAANSEGDSGPTQVRSVHCRESAHRAVLLELFFGGSVKARAQQKDCGGGERSE